MRAWAVAVCVRVWGVFVCVCELWLCAYLTCICVRMWAVAVCVCVRELWLCVRVCVSCSAVRACTSVAGGQPVYELKESAWEVGRSATTTLALTPPPSLYILTSFPTPRWHPFQHHWRHYTHSDITFNTTHALTHNYRLINSHNYLLPSRTTSWLLRLLITYQNYLITYRNYLLPPITSSWFL